MSLRVRLGGEGGLRRDEVDMDAVEDEPGPDLAMGQRRADRAGLAAFQRRHGVEQVGEAGGARGQGEPRSLRTAAAVWPRQTVTPTARRARMAAMSICSGATVTITGKGAVGR